MRNGCSNPLIFIPLSNHVEYLILVPDPIDSIGECDTEGAGGEAMHVEFEGDTEIVVSLFVLFHCELRRCVGCCVTIQVVERVIC